MSSKSKKGSKGRKSRTPYYALALILVVVVSAVGYYVYTSRTSAPSNNPSIICTKEHVICATLDTTDGSFEVELFNGTNQAPKTVANFVSLAEEGFYDNLVWHRIDPGFVIQTGDPNTRNGGGSRAAWGTGGSNHTIPLEVSPSLKNNYGYLGMARSSDPNSATSQFYINLANNTSLNMQYAVFGKVIGDGMNVVNALAATPIYTSGTYQDQPIKPVFLISVTIMNA